MPRINGFPQPSLSLSHRKLLINIAMLRGNIANIITYKRTSGLTISISGLNHWPNERGVRDGDRPTTLIPFK